MKKTVIILVLSVSTASLLGLCFVQQQQIQRITAQREAQPAQTVEPGAQAKLKRPIAAAEKKVTAGRTKTAEVREVQAETKTELAVIKSEPAPAHETPMADLAKMMKTPGMKDIIRAQQKGQQDLMYGAIFKGLQLSDAELEAFKGVLLDKQMALVDISMEMMSGSATAEEKKAATDKMRATTAAYDAKIKESLGDDNYALYKSFEDTQPERMQVNQFKGSLTTGDPLSEEQEDLLIRALRDARSNFVSTVPGVGDMQSADPSQFTPERIAKLLAENAKLQEQYAAKAATILTPNQLEQFKANQKQQQAMQEMGLRMAGKMFGTASAK